MLYASCAARPIAGENVGEGREPRLDEERGGEKKSKRSIFQGLG